LSRSVALGDVMGRSVEAGARFAMAKAQRDSQQSGAKGGVSEDLYYDLQRNSRRLGRCKIRASEVHIKKDPPRPRTAQEDWEAIARDKARVDDQRDGSPTRIWTPRRVKSTADAGAGFALPNYILEMSQELLEEEFDDAFDDDNGSPPGLNVGLADLCPGLGEASAAAAFSISSLAAATACVATDQPSVMTSCQLAELSVNTAASAGPGAATGSGSRAAPSNRKQALPLPPLKEILKASQMEGLAPRMPIVETMPQHLASDVYWVHRPVYVSAQQVRWEKDFAGHYAVISMRTEIMSKVCGDGRRTVQKDKSGKTSKTGKKARQAAKTDRNNMMGSTTGSQPVGPAEARILATEPMRRNLQTR